MRLRFDSLLTVILVICTLMTTGIVVHHEFFNGAETRPLTDHKPVMIPHWQDYLALDERVGPSQAKITLIEFGDFECPFCGAFHKTFKAIRDKYPRVGLT